MAVTLDDGRIDVTQLMKDMVACPEKLEEFAVATLGQEEVDRLRKEQDENVDPEKQKYIRFPDFRGMSEDDINKIIMENAGKHFLCIKNEDEVMLEVLNVLTLDDNVMVIGNVINGIVEKGAFFEEFGYVKAIRSNGIKLCDSAVRGDPRLTITFSDGQPIQTKRNMG